MNNIKFHGKQLTETKVVNNIIRVFNASNEFEKSDLWYQNANDFCFANAFRHNLYNTTGKKLSLRQLAGITAALSPLASWNHNKSLVEKFISLAIENESTENLQKLGCLSLGREKATAIFALCNDFKNDDVAIKNVLNGDKIKSFYDNIVYHETSQNVTIDRHALSIALGFKLSSDGFQKNSMTKAQYQFFVNCYLKAAKKVNLTGLTIQAITWVVWRKRHNEIKMNNILKLK